MIYETTSIDLRSGSTFSTNMRHYAQIFSQMPISHAEGNRRERVTNVY